MYSTLAKFVELVVEEENPDPIHHTRTIQTHIHKMTRTPGCPALRTGMVGEIYFTVNHATLPTHMHMYMYVQCIRTIFHIYTMYMYMYNISYRVTQPSIRI